MATATRESLSLDVVTREDGAARLPFRRSLVACGLTGVRLATSDAHPGLVDAIAATPADANWQRSSVHRRRRGLYVVTAIPAGSLDMR